jgi:multisubunit Na+/H+ antiporter MnhE subunit
VAWVALFWLWLLLAGEWNAYEWVAGASAATVAATAGEVIRARAGRRARLSPRRLADVRLALPMVFVDFGIVMWALVRSVARRRVVRGVFRAREYRAGGRDPTSVGRRAWVALLADYSPNAYIVDLDAERNVVLLHDLVPFRRSEEPV